VARLIREEARAAGAALTDQAGLGGRRPRAL